MSRLTRRTLFVCTALGVVAALYACSDYVEEAPAKATPEASSPSPPGPSPDPVVPDAAIEDADAEDAGAEDAGAEDADAGAAPLAVLLVVTGPNETCALLEGGRLKCFGENAVGQLGLGSTTPHGGAPPDAGPMGDELPFVFPADAGKIVDVRVSGGYSTTTRAATACALFEGGAIRCWGANNYGQLGLGTTEAIGGRPEHMVALPAVDLGTGFVPAGLAVGSTHTCARSVDGGAKCWGRNAFGQLGYDGVASRGGQIGQMGDALPLLPLSGVESMCAGSGHTCALANGVVRCWGQNDFGQLGVDDLESRGADGGITAATPAAKLPAPAVKIACGQSFTCALLTTRELVCWGNNEYGQLGVGDSIARGTGLDGGRMEDMRAVDLEDDADIVDVTCGEYTTCARLESGRAKCFGINGHGQLGLEDKQPRGNQPGQLGDALPSIPFEPITSIATHTAHTCFVSASRLRCIGRNAAGQLGYGDNTSRGGTLGYWLLLPFVDLGSR